MIMIYIGLSGIFRVNLFLINVLKIAKSFEEGKNHCSWMDEHAGVVFMITNSIF